MKFTVDQYYYVYFCMLEEPAMAKPHSYSSEFVSIRQSFLLSTDNASFQAKNIRAGSPDLFMSMVRSLLEYGPLSMVDVRSPFQSLVPKFVLNIPTVITISNLKHWVGICEFASR